MSGSNGIKRILNGLADLVLANTRVIMPVVLVVCVLITVVIAINARDRADTEKTELPQSEYVPEENEVPEMIVIPEFPLELNKYPQVNALIKEYYDALANGDSVRASEICPELGEVDLIRLEEIAKYYDYYDTIEVFTKPGLTEDSYVVYVSSKVKFYEAEALVPGLMWYYVLPDAEGNLYITKKNLEENVYEYVVEVSLQDNSIDLNNKIAVEFNDMIAEDKELEEFIAFMSAKINIDVGVVLAQIVQPDITADLIRSDMEDEEDESDVDDNQQIISTTMLARATDVVNIRSSDSETADRIDRAIVGQEFTVLEQKGNGWSRITYNNRDAYIKSEFLEIISVIGGNETASSAESIGKVKVKSSNVRIRSTPSTSGDILGTANTGERFDLVEEVNGWVKIKYNNQLGYIRNDFVDKE